MHSGSTPCCCLKPMNCWFRCEFKSMIKSSRKINPVGSGGYQEISTPKSYQCWWQCAKGPFWQDHKDHSGTGCWSGNITRLAGWRDSDLTLRKLPLQGKVQKRIVRPAARGVPQWP